jgi:hypothetical protein
MTTGDHPAKTRKQETMTEQGNQDSTGRWLPGKTGNAAGRGMTNRQGISENLLSRSEHLNGDEPAATNASRGIS